MAESNAQRRERYLRQFMNRLDDIRWTPLGDYVNDRHPLLVACPAGHEQSIRPHNWSGTCPACNPFRGIARSAVDS